MRIHHVQVAIPEGGESLARTFWVDALGFREVPKPPAMAARGGCWFRVGADDEVTAEIHVGVERPFTPAAKAHPALVVGSAAQLEHLGARLADRGFTVDWSQRHTVEGSERFHCFDPFGNRVEILTGG
jgi:catechol 2,3-dioxygenase-like lactoylglutathione lyase family enzyme